MKIKIIYNYLAVISFFIVCVFSSCKDDDVMYDEWNSTYVYLSRPNLGVSGIDATVYHSGNVIKDIITLPITIKLSKPLPADITVNLQTNITGELPKELISFRNGQSVTIAKGATEYLDTLDIDFNKWKEVPSSSGTYRVDVRIDNISPKLEELRISTEQNSLFVNITKTVKSNIITGKKPDKGIAFTNRSTWDVSTTTAEGTAFTTSTDLTDNQLYTSVFADTYLGILVDLKQEKNITGFQTQTSYKNNKANACKVETSVDGKVWTEQCDKSALAYSTSEKDQYASFITPVKARYLKVHLYAAKKCTSDEFYVWGEE